MNFWSVDKLGFNFNNCATTCMCINLTREWPNGVNARAFQTSLLYEFQVTIFFDNNNIIDLVIKIAK